MKKLKIIFILTCFLSLVYGAFFHVDALQNLEEPSEKPISLPSSLPSQIPIAQNADHTVKIYASPPCNFIPAFEISACYSQFENEYLLLHRSENIKNQPGVWGVPGGKVNEEETPLEATLREFLEETGIQLDPQKTLFFKTVYIRDSKNDFIFHMFTYDFQEQQPVVLNPKEHQAALWVTFDKAVLLPLLLGEVECFWILKQSEQVRK